MKFGRYLACEISRKVRVVMLTYRETGTFLLGYYLMIDCALGTAPVFREP
jgi:hypothetical protein